MPVKLTLSVDKRVIERAKRFSRQQNKSLSKLVEGYLRKLTGVPSGREDITPKVAALSGVIPPGAVRGVRRADYADFLTEKYR
ncbi:MAG: hypothetical protein B7Z62_05765 [Deltaproteobacteria bacterium 37-65-8]|nr:DUF6364 family protein [Deltaproteobacteria bacterium]OYV97582.1 MAG: hypothetical protein B7Z62_05765 [Deltaproteobacteria bacterium 37-65-8]HQT98291.1 DUF6364 family protein [Thermodesulfobacteriota bacterium]